MPWVPTVRTIVNGEPVDAATTNGPIADLTTRTNFLYSQLQTLAVGRQLILPAQTVQSGLVNGTVVYLDTVTNTFKAATVSVDDQTFLAGDSTFWQGLVQNVSGTTADIFLFGSMTQSTVNWALVFDGGIFASGEVFLSGTNPGFITTEPTTTAVHIGHMRSSGELLVRATSPNAFLDHIHYQRTMVGSPAGTVVDPAFGGVQTISVPNPALQGWLPANATYFPGFVVGVQIPTGAFFGYNIQQVSETALRQVFPMLPSSAGEFSQSGVILSTSQIVVNQYGIWWMDNTYGNAPWPVDYTASPTAAPITVWTTRIVAQQTTIELLLDVLLNALAAGAIDTVAVATIKSTAPTDLLVVGSTGDATNGFQGDVQLTPLGVNNLKIDRGLGATATGGDNVTGYKGTVELAVNLELPATHVWTELFVGTDKVTLLTTNGVSSGASINARGHRLGGTSTDYIDWLITGGSDLLPGVDYEVVLTLKGCVDTATGAPVAGTVTVADYRLIVGDPVGSTQFVRQDVATFNTGLPGQLQQVVLGPFGNLVLTQGQQLLVRVKPTTGGSPLPVNTFRQLSLTYTLTAV